MWMSIAQLLAKDLNFYTHISCVHITAALAGMPWKSLELWA